MANKAWGIKLGSGGRCVAFCEKHGIVGIGWKDVDQSVLISGSRDDLARHVRDRCTWYTSNVARGAAVGQLHRFARECQVGDYVLYYDPRNKHVRVCRVMSGPLFRDFEPDDQTDIWHYRKVECPVAPIPILDFHGTLKGRLLGPRMSFWALHPVDIVQEIVEGVSSTRDEAFEAAFTALQDLVLHRAEALHDTDWEWLVVDYFKAQGAQVDERMVGGSRPIIDVEATFHHGELGEEVWRVQVKRYQDRRVDWPEIEADLVHVGDDARFCYVSVYGFTDEARARADEENVRLMEAGDFTRFLLGGRVRDSLRRKLRIPVVGR